MLVKVSLLYEYVTYIKEVKRGRAKKGVPFRHFLLSHIGDSCFTAFPSFRREGGRGVVVSSTWGLGKKAPPDLHLTHDAYSRSPHDKGKYGGGGS